MVIQFYRVYSINYVVLIIKSKIFYKYKYKVSKVIHLGYAFKYLYLELSIKNYK